LLQLNLIYSFYVFMVNLNIIINECQRGCVLKVAVL
jgi:hypothetical protein